MTIRKPTEIRLLVEFLWRTLFGYSNYLHQRQQFNREFSGNLITSLTLIGLANLHTMHPEGETREMQPDPLRQKAAIEAFQKEYNEFCRTDYVDITTAGLPHGLEQIRLEIAAATRIERLTKTIYTIYQKQTTA
jgi:hypothetical protein